MREPKAGPARLPSLVMAFVFGATGCANLGVPRTQELSEPLPQGLRVEQSPDYVYALVSYVVTRSSDCGIMVDSPVARVVSWCETIEGWRDLGQDTAGPEITIMSGSLDPNSYEPDVTESGEGYALTTVWVEPLDAKSSNVRVRRVMVGAESVPGLGHSRGDFEREFGRGILRLVASGWRPTSIDEKNGSPILQPAVPGQDSP